MDKDGDCARLCADDIVGGQLVISVDISDDDDGTPLFDAFLANVLNAAAKEDAWGV